MPSIFSKIIKGEIPCHKVWEDDKHFAFLDINPWTEGHTLVVPKKEHDYLFDMPDADYAAMLLAAKKVAALLKSKLGCKRVCTCVIGYEVPHAHIHLLPTNATGDIRWLGQPPATSMPDLAKLAARLKS